jgi:hypothetical protein
MHRAAAMALGFTLLLSPFLISCNRNKNNAGQSGNTQQSAAQPISIDDLVAPIALYPDQLLGQMLAVSTNPQEVLDVGNWLLQNQNLQGDALTSAAKQAGFSPSAQYLAAFPQVVDQMCQQMDWTRQLGEAFKDNQKGVLDAIQRKRTEAQQMGNLASSPQMTVDNKTEQGQQVTEIKPADPKTVYVPQYNPVTIYNTPAPAAPAQSTTTAATTTEDKKSGVSTGAAVGIGLLSFGVGMLVGHAISDNDNYYPYPAWGYGGMYYSGRPYYPPPYRPPVYPGYRPVYGYNPPSNYRWSQYNHNVNVTVNNNNYYNRFNRTAVNNTNANARLGAEQNRGGQPAWKGQSTYAGARPGQQAHLGQSPGSFNDNRLAANPHGTGRNNYAAPAARNEKMATRNASVSPGVVPASSRTALPSSQPANARRSEDRGFANPAPQTSSARPSTQNNQRQNQSSRSSAFGSGNGQSERAASSRGRESMHANPGQHGGRRR